MPLCGCTAAAERRAGRAHCQNRMKLHDIRIREISMLVSRVSCHVSRVCVRFSRVSRLTNDFTLYGHGYSGSSLRELTVVLDVAIRSARPAAPPAAGPRRRGVYTI